ncbi:MAG: sigma-54 dependent transcriptional regulator [Syntrophales bacterium]|nr:sigma-54 dependent transcriptional regulator [Syntrophales bacterium]MDD5233989.1 sigma-54 dependent transcriptional regulator [Syntrophales bacterium]MDD5532438.1 sigma-54 dependent transcriptional regulator [Syntrophales bacterium]HPL62703.1 sigma-54 dependent transcriptional regulator [Syntrophales bacterium]
MGKQLQILIIEDGTSQREMLRDFLAGEGHFVEGSEDGEKGLQRIREGHFDLVLLDYKMPGKNGLEVLKEIKQINPEIDVIMMTAYGTIETAVGAMKAGAVDYITKPIELEDLLLHIGRISERRTLLWENEILRQELREKGVTTDRIIYGSRKMEALVNMAGRVASSRATILIQGESGTGKELFARLIHNLSPRTERPLIAVNCGALHENLLESELFGHEKGAFTGAVRRRIGRFEEADGGTLFLDEVGEMSPSVQVKLLRFLQEKEFQRLGGNQSVRADVRIISATNKDLESKVRDGSFREDLFYRLNVVCMLIPPLRERKEDIPLLIDFFLGRFSRENGKDVRGVSREAKDLLVKYDYPGNVRELENIIERAVVICRGPVITVEDLPFREPPKVEREVRNGGKLRESVEALEYQLIRKAMEEAANHQTRAADILGISERMLRYKLKKYHFKS